MKNIVAIFIALILIVASLVGCNSVEEVITSNESANIVSDISQETDNLESASDINRETEIIESANLSDETEAFEYLETLEVKTSYDDETASANTSIILSDDELIIEGQGADYSDFIITISQEGAYEFMGQFEGQIKIEADEEADVQLIFKGVELSSNDMSPIYVVSADEVIITLMEGTVNTIYDGSDYTEEVDDDTDEERLNGAIYSKDDLVINGNGELIIEAVYKTGILGKDDVSIMSGVINIDAGKNGIKGKDMVYIEGGSIDIQAVSDGIESDLMVYINGGDIQIQSDDDGIQSDESVHIIDGTVVITAGDDGIHGDLTVQIDGGEVRIEDSYEGIEGQNVVINDGIISINASDDGINTADGTVNAGITQVDMEDQAMMQVEGGMPQEPMMGMEGGIESPMMGAAGGMPQEPMMGAQGDIESPMMDVTSGRQQPMVDVVGDFALYINGGQLTINSYSDGLDSNGNIWMTGGVVIVSGPTVDSEGSIDYNGTFEMTGGYLVASGSTGMLQTPSATSAIYSLVVGFDQALDAGTAVSIIDSEGTVLLSYEPVKAFQSVQLSSEDLAIGETYTVTINGNEYTTLEMTESITLYGTFNTRGGMGGPGR